MVNEDLKFGYPQALVYATDWNQYQGQHNPKHENYEPARAWLTGFLLEENPSHITLALTVFENGDVREVVCIPRSCILALEKLIIEQK